MLKGFCINILLVVCLAVASLFIVQGKEAQAAASSKWIVTTQKAPVYDYVDGKQVTIGTLLAWQLYEVVTEDQNYYYVPFGNATGFIKKGAHIKTATKKQIVQSKSKKPVNSNLSIVTKTESIVFNRIDKKQKAIALVKGNIRYPVARKISNWYLVNVGGQLGYIHESKVYEDLGIPVLMYHHMLEQPEQTPFEKNSMVIKVSEFQKQMDYLKQNGWKTILLQELDRYLNNEQNLTGKVAVITFDDNYLSMQKYAYPILKENNQKAVSFVIGGKTRSFAQSWDPMTLQYMGYKEMKETIDIFDFQHHTNGMHLRERETLIPYLISKTQKEIELDLIKGREHIGKPLEDPSSIQYLAYPWGQYSSHTIQAAKAAGIRLAFTTETGNVQRGDQPYILKRQGIGPYHTMDDFVKKIEGRY
ncbi:polysaccharide deacetylase family protein [Bacillus aerolatus]|uniref:Polysaccharide deacetylase family protein n=1 Tax=Bacillus aerolatus TaxID=2653354 RepID=A0A6I1FLY2_9BACI|nr:polysaccharide deacetylase family protein [Bacillus aerolatus]KAB7707359.1 polysaccharide deacetylase family protein [Bacillus aerolatus]